MTGKYYHEARIRVLKEQKKQIDEEIKKAENEISKYIKTRQQNFQQRPKTLRSQHELIQRDRKVCMSVSKKLEPTMIYGIFCLSLCL